MPAYELALSNWMVGPTELKIAAWVVGVETLIKANEMASGFRRIGLNIRYNSRGLIIVELVEVTTWNIAIDRRGLRV